jgi:ArsR family transcriptional regulator
VKQTTPEPAAAAGEALAVLRSLGDSNRMKIFLALRERERCVRDLVATQDLPQPLVSHHLRALARAGLVQARRSDGFTFYALDPAGMSVALEATTALLDPETVGPQARPGGNEGCCR